MGRSPAPLGRLAVATVLVALGAGGCDSAQPPGSGGLPESLSHYVGDELSFDYPSSWNAARFDVVSSFSNVLVDLSTAPLADPCDRTANSVACVREAAAALGPDGVLVEWSRNEFPGWRFDPSAGQPIGVGGRRATMADAPAEEPCRGIGGERELTVTIDDVVPDQNWVSVRACLRGPDLDGLRARIGAMLASVVWHR